MCVCVCVCADVNTYVCMDVRVSLRALICLCDYNEYSSLLTVVLLCYGHSLDPFLDNSFF